MQKLKFIWHNLSFEDFIFIMKENLHKIIGVSILVVSVIFFGSYILNERNSNNQKLVGHYVMSANYFAQNDSVLALQNAQIVYNNSKELLEVASLMQVVEILFKDKQYSQIFEILRDAISLKKKPDNAFLLYSFIFSSLQKLEKDGFEKEKIQELTKQIQQSLEKIAVIQNYSSHKMALLIELNAKTQLREKNYYIVNQKGSSKNEMQNILKQISEN